MALHNLNFKSIKHQYQSFDNGQNDIELMLSESHVDELLTNMELIFSNPMDELKLEITDQILIYFKSIESKAKSRFYLARPSLDQIICSVHISSSNTQEVIGHLVEIKKNKGTFDFKSMLNHNPLSNLNIKLTIH